MQPTTNRPADSYSPLHFLASLGAGGLTVTFFMYLIFWVPHPGQSVPVFEDIARVLRGDSTALKIAAAVAMAGIAVFGFLDVKPLIRNLSALSRFRRHFDQPGSAAAIPTE